MIFNSGLFLANLINWSYDGSY